MAKIISVHPKWKIIFGALSICWSFQYCDSNVYFNLLFPLIVIAHPFCKIIFLLTAFLYCFLYSYCSSNYYNNFLYWAIWNSYKYNHKESNQEKNQKTGTKNEAKKIMTFNSNREKFIVSISILEFFFCLMGAPISFSLTFQ